MHARTIIFTDGEKPKLTKGFILKELIRLPQILLGSGFDPAAPPYVFNLETLDGLTRWIQPPRDYVKLENYATLLLIFLPHKLATVPATTVSGYDNLFSRLNIHDSNPRRIELVCMVPGSKLLVHGFKEIADGNLVPEEYAIEWRNGELSVVESAISMPNDMGGILAYHSLTELKSQNLSTFNREQMNAFVYSARMLAQTALKANDRTLALECIKVALQAAYADPSDMSDWARSVRALVHEDVNKLAAARGD
jgi:hypothetical protein